MTSNQLKLSKRMSYTLSTIARRIINKVKESYSYLFVIAIAGVLSVLGVVTQPFFVSPLQWSNLSWFNFQVVFSRFIVASPLVVLFVLAIILLPKQIRKIDDKRDDKLVNAIKDTFKEALKEHRETIKDEIVKHDIEKIQRHLLIDEMTKKLAEEKKKLEGNKGDTETT